MRHVTKKRALVLSVVAALSVSAAAFAFFTANGSGTGSASVGTSTAVTVNQIGTLGALYPTTSQPITVSVTNPGSGSQYVGSVKLASIASDKPGCDSSVGGANPAFTMADIAIDQNVAAGATSAQKLGTLTMNDTLVNQDACQGATLTLSFTSN